VLDGGLFTGARLVELASAVLGANESTRDAEVAS
jgi:hypothetical protein